ncbi:MAG TPA: hypothetical protein VF384_17145 [Planctomycetota bacterium]
MREESVDPVFWFEERLVGEGLLAQLPPEGKDQRLEWRPGDRTWEPGREAEPEPEGLTRCNRSGHAADAVEAERGARS